MLVLVATTFGVKSEGWIDGKVYHDVLSLEKVKLVLLTLTHNRKLKSRLPVFVPRPLQMSVVVLPFSQRASVHCDSLRHIRTLPKIYLAVYGVFNAVDSAFHIALFSARLPHLATAANLACSLVRALDLPFPALPPSLPSATALWFFSFMRPIMR